MVHKLDLDFVSDIACPWCAIGLGGLEKSLRELEGEIEATIAFRPFELNPDMPAGGENEMEHVDRKYGMTPLQVREVRKRMKELAAAVGFTINTTDDSRAYNTFSAHRLIAWAGEKGRQLEMKRQLLTLYFTNQQDPGDLDAVADAAEAAGLNGREARELLATDRYVEQVRAEETLWRERGINSVPAVIVGGRYLITGGQPPEEFTLKLRAISAELSK